MMKGMDISISNFLETATLANFINLKAYFSQLSTLEVRNLQRDFLHFSKPQIPEINIIVVRSLLMAMMKEGTSMLGLLGKALAQYPMNGFAWFLAGCAFAYQGVLESNQELQKLLGSKSNMQKIAYCNGSALQDPTVFNFATVWNNLVVCFNNDATMDDLPDTLIGLKRRLGGRTQLQITAYFAGLAVKTDPSNVISLLHLADALENGALLTDLPDGIPELFSFNAFDFQESQCHLYLAKACLEHIQDFSISVESQIRRIDEKLAQPINRFKMESQATRYVLRPMIWQPPQPQAASVPADEDLLFAGEGYFELNLEHLGVAALSQIKEEPKPEEGFTFDPF